MGGFGESRAYKKLAKGNVGWHCEWCGEEQIYPTSAAPEDIIEIVRKHSLSCEENPLRAVCGSMALEIVTLRNKQDDYPTRADLKGVYVEYGLAETVLREKGPHRGCDCDICRLFRSIGVQEIGKSTEG